MKEEGTPRSSVAESSFETKKVIRMPRRMTAVSASAETAEESSPPAAPTKNMLIMAMRVGKRPLQGTKLLVSMAISRSRGESMMRQPTIPAALQPKPMHMDGSFPNAVFRVLFLTMQVDG